MTENTVSRRNFLKKAVPIIAGVGLAGALGMDRTFGALTTTSTANGTGPSTTPGTPLATASYIIAPEKNFEAQNGTTGKIDFSGLDATQVIQSAVDALQGGGLVFLRRGTYPTIGKLDLKQGIYLGGEQGAIIKIADASQSPTNPFNMIEIDGDNVTIEGLELDGNSATNPNIAGTTLYPAPANPDMQSGVVVHSGRNVSVLNCYVHDTWNAGVWLAAQGIVDGTEIGGCLFESTGVSHADPSTTNRPQSANAIYALRFSGSTSRAMIHNNFFKDTYGRAVYLHFDSDSVVTDNVITNSRECITETAGIVLDDFVKRSIVRGNRISGYAPGIYVVWRGCENIIIEGNMCTDAPNAGASGFGILLENATAGAPISTGIVVKGNICSGNALPGIGVAASNVLVQGNICCNNNVESGDIAVRQAGILIRGAPDVGVDGVLISGNRCFDDQAIQTQQYGISMSQEGNTISTVMLTDNDLRGNGSGAIGLLDAQSFHLKNNTGYNPIGLESVDAGLVSPFSYANKDGVSEAIYITGGTVSDISKNGQTIFSSSPATVLLNAGDVLTITHSDPPKILRDLR